jgi:hypothetical protein
MLRAWLRPEYRTFALLLSVLTSPIGASAGDSQPAPPAGPAAHSASTKASITLDQAMDILLALPEIKAWKSHVERVSKGTLHGKLLAESDEPVVVKGRKYWSVSFVEDHPDRVHRWEFFLVSMDGKQVLVQDSENDRLLTLDRWRRQERPMERAKP